MAPLCTSRLRERFGLSSRILQWRRDLSHAKSCASCFGTSRTTREASYAGAFPFAAAAPEEVADAESVTDLHVAAAGKNRGSRRICHSWSRATQCSHTRASDPGFNA